MVFRTPRARETLHIILAAGIMIFLLCYRLSIELVDPLRNYFKPRTDFPVVDVLTNALFVWLVVLMILAFRNWRHAVKREQELERVLSSISPDVFMVVTPDRKISMINGSIAAMFGYRPEEVIDKTTDTLYFDRRSDRERSGEIFDCLQKFGFHIGYATGKRKNGQTFPLEIITGDLNGHPGAVVLIRDITERKRAEEALHISNRELREAHQQIREAQKQLIQQERLRVLGQMSSYVAHEFNNALTPILGFSELLTKRPDILQNTEAATEYLADIRTAAQDAAAIIRRLSDFYRTKDQEDVGPIDLDTTIREAISVCRPKWKVEAEATERKIQVITDFAELPPLHYNREEIHEVITNLIFNAVDAMPDGGTINIRTFTKHDKAVIQVSDTGTGMRLDTRERCFEPFFTEKGAEGTGLGLTIVANIVHRLHGTIDITTAENKGTEFRIRLPLSNAPTTPLKDMPPEGVSVFEPLSILVVDDEPLVGKVVAAQLTESGHTVQIARNGTEALNLFHKNTYDMVITDWAMPEMNGKQVGQKIKAIAPEMPVILMSGVDSESAETISAKNSGVDFILKKPITRDILLKAVLRANARRPTKVNTTDY
ncbi:MAG: response regulator [Candidatus Pacebacteria bacterium]|nr:response regulator [Candidatus Paceibacterota bacterium]